MESELEAIGIPVELTIVDWATLVDYRNDPTLFDMYITTFAEVPVPSLKLYFGADYPCLLYTSSIGRTWQCGTIQLDFQLPQRFEAEYVAEDGSKKRPIMIHRVCFGSIERFIGILIEHYAGKFPVWLAPVQVKVIPVSEKSMDYATGVYEKLRAAGIRTELDHKDEKVGYKIRQAQLEKVPFMLVLGEKEAAEGAITVRSRDQGDLGAANLDEFIAKVQKMTKSREN